MEPTSLQEAILYFSKPANCREYLVARRWPNGVTCPRCGSDNVLFLEKYNRWHCRQKHQAPQFTLKTGTIFEDSPIGLDKWLTAMWMIVNCKNGVSSWEISRTLKITQKSAWFMDHRIRLALQSGSIYKLGGPGSEIESDETFVGGKAKNMHANRRAQFKIARESSMTGDANLVNKTAVWAVLDRDQRQVRATVVPKVVPPQFEMEKTFFRLRYGERMRNERKHYTAEEKVAILRRHLLDKVPVSDLCEELGLRPTVFYRWQKEFFENGSAAFQSKERPARQVEEKQKRIEFLEKKVQTKDEVLAELMAEHIALKKSLGEL